MSMSVFSTHMVTSEEPDVPDHPWPGFGGNPGNTGLSTRFTGQVDGRNHRSWGHTHPFLSSPAVSADSRVFIGSDDGYLHAFDYDTNFVNRWSFETGGTVVSSPALDPHGNVYFGSNDRNLYALDSGGRKLWEFETRGAVTSSPGISADGVVYVGSRDGHVYAVNPDGTERWSHPTNSPITSSPAIGVDGTVYIGTSGGDLLALSGSGGSLRWRFETGGEIHSSPAVSPNGTIYFGSSDHKIYALNLRGGYLWHFTTDGPIRSSPSVGKDEVVYFGSDDGHLYAVDERGELIWKFSTGGPVEASPALGADGTVYFGSHDGFAYAVNSDGTEKWRTDMGGTVVSSPAIGCHGTVFMASTRGMLFAFIGVPSAPRDLTISVDDGRLLLNWEHPLDVGGGEIQGYWIYRWTPQDNITRHTWIPDRSSYIDDEVTIGETYNYMVSAINYGGEGLMSEIVNATAAVVPGEPRGLESHPGDSMVRLVWEPPEYLGGVDLDEYFVYRREKGNESVLVAIVSSHTPEYEDKNVTNRVTYYYSVSAVNPAGEGASTQDVSAMPTTSYSVVYCFVLPTLIVSSILIAWFIHWYRRWGRYDPPSFYDGYYRKRPGNRK